MPTPARPLQPARSVNAGSIGGGGGAGGAGGSSASSSAAPSRTSSGLSMPSLPSSRTSSIKEGAAAAAAAAAAKEAAAKDQLQQLRAAAAAARASLGAGGASSSKAGSSSSAVGSSSSSGAGAGNRRMVFANTHHLTFPPGQRPKELQVGGQASSGPSSPPRLPAHMHGRPVWAPLPATTATCLPQFCSNCPQLLHHGVPAPLFGSDCPQPLTCWRFLCADVHKVGEWGGVQVLIHGLLSLLPRSGESCGVLGACGWHAGTPGSRLPARLVGMLACMTSAARRLGLPVWLWHSEGRGKAWH